MNLDSERVRTRHPRSGEAFIEGIYASIDDFNRRDRLRESQRRLLLVPNGPCYYNADGTVYLTNQDQLSKAYEDMLLTEALRCGKVVPVPPRRTEFN